MATIVDPEVLGKLVVSALVAGVGITAIFGLAIYGSTRFLDSRRQGREAAAWAFAGLAVLAAAGFAAAVAYGIVVMTNKG